MMATILPFRPKSSTGVTLNSVIVMSSNVTPEEFRNALTEETLQWCRNLLAFYKRTGRWHESCEASMTTAVLALKDVCTHMAVTSHEN